MTRSISLAVSWQSDGPEFRSNALQKISISLLSNQVVELLDRGKPAFAIRRDDDSSCSRVVSALLVEIDARGYLMCPIEVGGRLAGIIAFATSDNLVPLEGSACQEIQTIGKLILTGIIYARRDARRLRDQNQWKKIADAACDFAISLDQSKEIRDVMRFGASEVPEVQGLRLTDFVSRPFKSDVIAIVDKSVKDGSSATCEFRGTGIKGGECWYHGRIEPHSRDSTTQATIYLSNNDALRAREDEIRTMNERLNRAARLSLLGQLSTEFAHQLNQPLQAMMAYCDTLIRREETGTGDRERNLKTLNNVMELVDHAAQIIVSIRDFVRFRSLTLEVDDLRSIIDRAIMMTSHTAAMEGAELVRIPIAPELLIDDTLDVLVDSVQTTHVLINLIVNAIEAGSAARTESLKIEVAVRAAPQAGKILVTVRDNGPGLPSDPEKVFEQFHSTKEEGLGIGLTISRNVIEAQGGLLTAANLPTGGCVFTILLKRASGNEADEYDLMDGRDLAKSPHRTKEPHESAESGLFGEGI
ncbi:MAG: GHKL domain-containing protein [Planctomyces sp.]|nr:GHKL domain-containing protein [Planctomyces sp.]